MRRNLLGLLIVFVVVLTAGCGGSKKVQPTTAISQALQIGSFAVSVPRGFDSAGPLPHPNTPSLTISNHVSPRAPSRVELDIGYVASAKGSPLRTSALPLDLAKLHAVVPGRQWGGFVSGGGSIYGVHIHIGSKASAGARASILRALSSIHRAS
jgi:hypothetical protein